MLDTAQPVLTLTQDPFSSETTDAIRSAYESVFSVPHRLLTLRSLISKLARGYVKSFNLHSDQRHVVQHYALEMSDYTVRVRLGAYMPGYVPQRTVSHGQSSNVLAINTLLKDLHRDWQRRRSVAQQDDYSILHHLVMRAFVLCSADAAFQCITTEGHWSVFFHDERARAQAEVVVERRK